MSDDDLQISILLKGDDARRFRAFKARERLMKDAEAGRKLILDQLAEIESAPDGADVFAQRKPMARAAARSEMRRVFVETLREVLDEVASG